MAQDNHAASSQIAYPPLLQGGNSPQQGSNHPESQPYPVKPNPEYQPPPATYGPQGYTETHTVITTQPASQQVTTPPQSQPALGLGATIIAAVSTIFVTCCLCWWALPFTIAGIILGITASSYGSSGNMKTARIHFIISVSLTIFGLVFAVVGTSIIVGVGVDQARRTIRQSLEQQLNN